MEDPHRCSASPPPTLRPRRWPGSNAEGCMMRQFVAVAMCEWLVVRLPVGRLCVQGGGGKRGPGVRLSRLRGPRGRTCREGGMEAASGEGFHWLSGHSRLHLSCHGGPHSSHSAPPSLLTTEDLRAPPASDARAAAQESSAPGSPTGSAGLVGVHNLKQPPHG